MRSVYLYSKNDKTKPTSFLILFEEIHRFHVEFLFFLKPNKCTFNQIEQIPICYLERFSLENIHSFSLPSVNEYQQNINK